MGISFLDSLGKIEKNKTPVLNSLRGIEKPLEEQEGGFLNYIGNLSRNIPELVAASADDNDPATAWIMQKLYRNAPEQRAQLTVIKQQLEQAKMQGSDAWSQVIDDLRPKNFFAKLNSRQEGMGSVGDMIAGIPQSLVSGIVAPIEAASGLNVSEKDIRVLSPEERADKIKETAALVISTGAGVLARAGATALIGRNIPSALEVASDATIAGLPKVVMGKVARKLTIGATEGITAGVSFGAVSRANREDQLSSMLLAIPFAPIGMAFEMLHIDKIDKKMQQAGDIFNLRQLQYSPDKSLFEISKDIESLATADDLAAAVINGKINLGKSFIVIRNTTPELWGKEPGLKPVKMQGLGIVIYSHGERFNSNADILVYHKDIFKDEVKARKSFEEVGFIPNEVVSYKGKDWIFTGETVKDVAKVGDIGLVLKDPKNGRSDTAVLSEIARKTDFDLNNPEVLLQSDMSLKGQVLAGFRNSYAGKGYHNYDTLQVGNPFYESNHKANQSVETGKPITFVGMRQERGQRLPATGTFFALTLEHLTGYMKGKWKGNTPEQIAQVKKAGGQNLGSMQSAAGKETIPGIKDNELRIHRLSFTNPFVFEGKHHSLIKDVTRHYDYVTVGGGISSGPIDWGKIFTETEMAAIKEAGSIEGKPVGVPTSKYLASLAPEKKEAYKLVLQAEHDKYTQKITYEEYQKIANDYFTKYGHDEGIGLTAGKTHPESHYAIVDRIVARAMRRNGHDAFVYKSSINNTEVVDMRTTASGGTMPYMDKATVTGLKSNVITPEKFIDKLYDEYKSVVQNQTDKPWIADLEEWAGQKGFLPEELPSLKRNFLERLHKEAVASLPENERAVYTKAIADNPLPNPTESFERLKRSTNANNMYFDTHDAGTIVLRDRTSNKELLRTQSAQEAEEFISRSGQERGIDLDGDRKDPPIFPSTPDNLPSPNEIPELHKAGRLEQAIAWLDSSVEWLTASRTFANSIDVTYGTTLQARIHDPLQVAVRKAHAMARPMLERLKNEVEKHITGMTKEDRAKVSNYLETMTPDQIIASGLGGRKLNDLEIQSAKQFSEVDINNLFKFRRRVAEIHKQFKKGNPQRKALIEASRIEFSIGPKELDAFKTMHMMRKMPLENASIGNAVRLARAMQDEGKGLILDRGLYAAKYMNAKQLAAANAMESLSKDLADKFGIPADKMLSNYFTHARLYNGGEITDVIKLFRSNKAADDFYASLIRTGEIDAYERDPIIAMRRYILAGYNHQHLTPAINNATKILKEELLKIPDAARIKVDKVVNQYMSDLRGMPTAADNFTQSAFDTFAAKVGLRTNTNIRREWINAVLSTITGATQGFRVVQGLRDFYANTRNVYSRLGVTRTSRVFELGANKELQGAYLRDGVIQGYGVLQFATPLEQELSAVGKGAHKIGEGINRFNQAGMKWSGQPSVFELFQTGVYAEARETVARISREIVEGKHGKLDSPDTYRKAYKDIELDAFDRGTQIEFDKLIQGGKYEKAADFLGRQSVAEIIGMFGNANHPFGWNRNIGRIAGQFGTWPTNYRHNLARTASQGEVGNRAKRLARVAVMDLGLTAVAAQTGISFYTWTALPSVSWMGGPSVDAARTVFDATVGFGIDADLARASLKKMLPYNPETDEWNIKHLLVPGSFFADDLAKAYDLVKNQNQMGMGIAKGFGLKVENEDYEAGFVEEYLQGEFGR